MAPAAAGAIATVVAEVCDMDSSSTSYDGMVPRINVLWGQLKGVLTGSPDAETVSALDRAIETGARQLTTLGTRLAAVVLKGNAATVATIEQQLTLACTLATNLATIASEYHLVRAAPALCGCVTLPLECGHALMTRAAVSGSEISRDTAAILQNQARLLAFVMGPHLGHRALAAQLAAPEPLLAWLSAAASTTLALHGPLHGRGLLLEAQLCLASLVAIMMSDVLQPHYLALRRDSGLQHNLVQMLVPALHAAAVAMQLPPDRRPGESNWNTLDDLLIALLSEPLFHIFAEQLESSSGGGFGPFVQRVLQSTCQLFAAAPASCPVELTGSNFAALWQKLASLLATICCQMGESFQQQQQQRGTAVPDAQRQQAARSLLQALSRLPTALRVAAGALTNDVLQDWCIILGTMDQLSVQEPGLSTNHRSTAAGGVRGYHVIDSLADVPAWCSAGTALLRALPHSASLAVMSGCEQAQLSESATARQHHMAACVSSATPATADGTAAGGARHLLAMSVAQAEAVLAAVSLQPALADEHVAVGLLRAIRHGPPVLATISPLRQALEGLAKGLQRESSAAAASSLDEVAALLHREPQPGDGLALAQVAATRSCAYLRCANLAGEGGPAAGQGAGSQRCSKALGAAKLAEQERAG
ncbi:hypothetical protein D9Q98_003685 [Chlorella vulgaris]|uniref:Uncharacterized protein n=1 Tax=Chlorella vulgaris TaxID=3077 RepID=A0A9D4TTN7_CHLVU|nr:hypothetical protein D9Q98_003685 [Chlorella vulgaris]